MSRILLMCVIFVVCSGCGLFGAADKVSLLNFSRLSHKDVRKTLEENSTSSPRLQVVQLRKSSVDERQEELQKKLALLRVQSFNASSQENMSGGESPIGLRYDSTPPNEEKSSDSSEEGKEEGNDESEDPNPPKSPPQFITLPEGLLLPSDGLGS